MFDVAMLASALALTVAGPTGATPREAPPAPSSTVSSSTRASDSQRYCVVETIVGTRLPKRECHTRSEWKDLGFDPLAGK